MTRFLTRIAALLLVGALAALPSPAPRAAESNDSQAVQEVVDQWFVVLNAMLNGDPKPFSDLYSHADDATYLGAEGSYRVGWEAIYRDCEEQAAKSDSGSVEPVELHVVVGDDMAFAAHVTKGTVRLPDGRTMEIAARETSVFRKEDGRWRMIAHHADGLDYWEDAFRK
jgi:uncharacterized protein (TIGR02246 family)